MREEILQCHEVEMSCECMKKLTLSGTVYMDTITVHNNVRLFLEHAVCRMSDTEGVGLSEEKQTTV